MHGEALELVAAINRARHAAGTVAGVNVVVGFGHRLWTLLAPDEMPEGFGDFESIAGPDGFAMASAQHDMWVWLHGAGSDGVFAVARIVAAELAPFASIVTEQASFMFGASLDLTGFEDGTENPPIDEAVEVATIPAGCGCAGGSVVLLQRWVHDLDGFAALEPPEREGVFGRTLYGSVELDEDVQLPTSHVRRVVIEDGAGEELEVFRRSTAYGGVRENGLVFVAFSADRARLQRMLERMAGVEDGQRDRLTEFSAPVASAWYVAPPLELLRMLDPTTG